MAIVPGVSRSGVTISAGLLLGLTREAAARFSFWLATPITIGAGVFKLRHLQAAELSGPFLWAVLVSGVTGLAAIHFFLSRLQHSGFNVYVSYRLVLGFLVLLLVCWGH
jgi:undecaprenyl-diphosphatase